MTTLNTHRVVVHLFADNSGQTKYFLVEGRNMADWGSLDPITHSKRHSRNEVRRFYRSISEGKQKFTAPLKVHQAFTGALDHVGYFIVKDGVTETEARNMKTAKIAELEVLGLHSYTTAPELIAPEALDATE
jgi:hypothetical protein